MIEHVLGDVELSLRVLSRTRLLGLLDYMPAGAVECKAGLTANSRVKHALHMRNVVRQLRLTRGLSQAALGDVLGVSRQTVNSIETGRYQPSLPLAIALARFFDKAVEEVFDVDA